MEKEKKHQRFSLPNIPLDSTSAGRKTKQDNKPHYKVVYPLRNRKKYGIGSDCNAAPNAEYIVTGHGYKFTRHNNKLTMNISSDIFFDDEPIPIIKPFPNRGVLKSQTRLPQIQSPKGPIKQLSHGELQQKLEDSIQKREKLHNSLIKVSVKLEEKKFKQQLQEMKVIKQYDSEINEIITRQKWERKELEEAHVKEIAELNSRYTTKMDNTKADGVRRQLILKEEIAQKEKIIEEDKANSEHNIVKNVKRKEEELAILHEKAINDHKMKLASKLSQRELAQINDTEKKYKCIIADMTTKHQDEIEIHIKKFENTFNKEKELATVTMSLEAVKMEIEQLECDKEDIINQQARTKVETQKVASKLNEHKKKFQAEVDKVKMRYSNRISELTAESTKLKKMITRKSTEITEMKIEDERRTRERLYKIRKFVLQARCSSTLSSTIDNEIEEKELH